MSDWYWVLLFAVAGVSFLFGRWRGIRDFEKTFDESDWGMKYECEHGVDARVENCVECELFRVRHRLQQERTER